MLWTYRHGGFTGQSEQIRWLIYYWQGAHASRQDKVHHSSQPLLSFLVFAWSGGGGTTVEVLTASCVHRARQR